MSTSVFTVPDSATLGDAWPCWPAIAGAGARGQRTGRAGGLWSRVPTCCADRLPGPDAHALVWHALLLQAVTEVMWTPVPSASADTDIRRVARVLLDTGLAWIAGGRRCGPGARFVFAHRTSCGL